MTAMDAAAWFRLFETRECPLGRAKLVRAAGHDLAVFHLSDPDRFVVTPNACPHAGGSLAAGELGSHTITCPWHAWVFDLHTGACPMAEHVRLVRYETRVEDGVLYVRLPPRPAAADSVLL